jgi:hypothetical protein
MAVTVNLDGHHRSSLKLTAPTPASSCADWPMLVMA